MRPQFLPHDGLQDLIDALAERGYQVNGPQVKEGAVVLAPLKEASQLPWGVRDKQVPGSYTIEVGDPDRAFDWVNGPSSLKPFLFKQQETLWQAAPDLDGNIGFESVVEARPVAVIGVKPCDLRGVAVQDEVFCGGDNVDIRYKARREQLFTVAVNCTRAAETCFCVSQGGSPKADKGYDLVMTEISGGLVIDSGSDKGQEVLAALSLDDASDKQVDGAEADIKPAYQQTRRTPPRDHLQATLTAAKDHPQWDVIGKRCESCGNCTKLCPTCICHKQMYLPSLDGDGGEQVREWASCHSEAHSYVSGKNLREQRRERYRMWVTHKFANMEAQYGAPACVGCGRCTAWCTNGIDLCENLNIITGVTPDETGAL